MREEISLAYANSTLNNSEVQAEVRSKPPALREERLGGRSFPQMVHDRGLSPPELQDLEPSPNSQCRLQSRILGVDMLQRGDACLDS